MSMNMHVENNSKKSRIECIMVENNVVDEETYVDSEPSSGRDMRPLIPPHALWPMTTMFDTLRWRTAYSIAAPTPEYLICSNSISNLLKNSIPIPELNNQG